MLAFSSAIRASVYWRGCAPPLIAAFSAGRPNESKPNGDEHRVALHRPIPDEHVAEGVVADVALVRRPARVGVHAQDVVGRTGVVGVDLVGAVLLPTSLPAGLHLPEVVSVGHGRQATGALRA